MRQHEPAKPQRRGECLARGAEVGDAFGGECLQRAEGRAVVAVLRVVVVLDDQAVDRLGPPHQGSRRRRGLSTTPNGYWWAEVTTTARQAVRSRSVTRLMVEAGDTRGVFIANLRLAEVLFAPAPAPASATLLRDLLSTSDMASVPLLKARAEALLAQATRAASGRR
jgi:hypothetical protein